MNGRGERPKVVIDCFVESARRHSGDHLVVVDVIRATTVAITSVATGRRCLLAATPEEALALRSTIGGALLAGEVAGEMPDLFDMNNSPDELVRRPDVERPVIVVSSSGVPLMLAAGEVDGDAEIACLRNMAAVARGLIDDPRVQRDVALLGAGSRGEFRLEDQLCAAWIAERLVAAGWQADHATREIIDRWRGEPIESIGDSASVAYLRRTNQLVDYEFVVDHVDDLDLRCRIVGREVVAEAGAVLAGSIAG